MLKSVQNLVNDAQQGATVAHYGNHSFERKGSLWYFRYHGAPICIVNPKDETVSISFCGYEGSPSTRRAINSYLTAFETYKNVDRIVHESLQ